MPILHDDAPLPKVKLDAWIHSSSTERIERVAAFLIGRRVIFRVDYFADDEARITFEGRAYAAALDYSVRLAAARLTGGIKATLQGSADNVGEEV